jgi:hypothetical protein
MGAGKRDFKKERFWAEIIERQKQGGKNQTQFCRDEGLAGDKFSYWKKVLNKRYKEKKPKPIAENEVTLPFVPLNISGNLDFANQQNADQIEISKIVLRISANADKTTIACILQSLGG